ncbi:hypothetical protein [Spiroplasma phoeniceum]|uniref:hypothetical protein n=1 Tax=Spiroplasma phoeniceum TaxID=47835 RepID=UPI00164ABF52|nr:hypothetical protein [Spiroplasma phoeniceum]
MALKNVKYVLINEENEPIKNEDGSLDRHRVRWSGKKATLVRVVFLFEIKQLLKGGSI